MNDFTIVFGIFTAIQTFMGMLWWALKTRVDALERRIDDLRLEGNFGGSGPAPQTSTQPDYVEGSFKIGNQEFETVYPVHKMAIQELQRLQEVHRL